MHTCPDCDQACSCSGDVEDHDTGDEFMMECAHCGERHADTDEGGWDDDEDDDQPSAQASPELRQVLADALAPTPPLTAEEKK